MELKEQKLADIRKQLDTIIEDIEVKSEKGIKLHEIEGHLFSSLLQLGLQLLGYYILLVKKLVGQQGIPLDSQGKQMKNKGERVRPYFSIFGRVGIARSKYYSDYDKTHYVLDGVLGLPSSHYSYLLEDWLAFGAVEVDFHQSVSQLERILGHKLHGMQSSRCTNRLSAEVESFYGSLRDEQKDWQGPEEDTHLSVGYDGKGVPIKRSQTERAAESVSTRLSKGQNRDVKREATVSVSSSFTPKQRSVDEIVASLFSCTTAKQQQPAKDKHVWHGQKHIRAFLSDKHKAIVYGMDNVLKRDRSGRKPIIVLIDGDRALEKAIKKTAEEKGVAYRVDAYILDFIHLLEYVWKVANAYWGEKHPHREAWVQQQARLFLQGQWQQALEQWQHILDTQPLTTTQTYNIQRAITYVGNRPHMLDYKTYLHKGYPITTGAVESACGHFVKSRMERNAMHWGKEGAQNMLNIRAVKKNGDWDGYMENFINKEQEKLYKKAA